MMMITPPMRAIHSSYCLKNCPRKEAEAPITMKIALKPSTKSSEWMNVAFRFTPSCRSSRLMPVTRAR